MLGLCFWELPADGIEYRASRIFGEFTFEKLDEGKTGAGENVMRAGEREQFIPNRIVFAAPPLDSESLLAFFGMTGQSSERETVPLDRAVVFI